MTYSRPGIRQTDATPRVPRADRSRILGGTPRVTGDTTGRVIDMSDPDQAGKNAGQQFGEIASFLEQISEPAIKIAERIDIERANRQVGDLIANNPDLPALFAESPEEVQNKIRSLSGRAQDMAFADLAKGQAFRFSKSFPAAVQSDALLQQPTTDENREAQAKRLTELRGEAMGGLTSLPPGYVSLVSGDVAAVEGQVLGDLEASRLKTQAQNDSAQQSAAIGGELVKASAGVIGINTGQGDVVSGRQLAADEQNEKLAARLQQNLQSGRFTPEQTMRDLWRGTGSEVIELLNDGDYNNARGVLSLLKTMTKTKIMVGPEGKTNFWDLSIPGANNSSKDIQTLIKQLENSINQSEKEGNVQKVKAYLSQYVPGLSSLDPAEQKRADEALRAGLSTSGLDPLAVLEVLETSRGISQGVGAPGPGQEIAYAELVGSDGFRNSTLEQRQQLLKNAYLEGRISRNQYVTGIKTTANQSETTRQIENDIRTARDRGIREGVDASSLDALSKAQKQFIENSGLSVDAEESKAILEQRAAQVKARAQEATRAEIEQRIANNETLNSDQQYDIWVKNLEAETQKEIEAYGLKGGTLGSSDQKTNTMVQNISALIKQDPAGVMQNPMKMFPPALLDSYEEATGEKPKDWKSVLKYLTGRMAQVKDADGKPMYGGEKASDAEAWFRNMYKGASKSDLEPQSPLEGTGLGFFGYNTGRISESELERLRGVRDGTRPRKRSDDEKNQAFDVESFINNSLNSIAGIVLPGGQAANAGTIENQENLQAMAQVWTKQKPLSLSTPALPQLAAAAPAPAPPMAMTSINHPFALAIGIAEGTRTPDGGVTAAYYGHIDPGNRVQNQGNFSAQQGQASPQIADRQWLGKLTRQQMNYQPLLERIGIRRGTQGYNRLMFNILDLTVQAPAAVPDFVAKAPLMLRQGLSIESIAKARADSFYSPSGRLDAPGFGNNFSRLFKDQRSRAGVWDLRSRL